MKTETFLIRDMQNLDWQIQSLKKEGFKPTLGVVFISVSLPIKQLSAIFATHQIALIGSTSCGEIFAESDEVSIADHSAVVMLLEMDPSAFHTCVLDDADLHSFELGKKAAQQTLGRFKSQSLIVMASGMKVDGQALVEGIMDVVGTSTPIFGGLAGDDAIFKETWVFCDDKFANNGVVLLCLDQEKVEVTGMATSGWISLGADLKVTSSQGNVVHSIDGRPALDVYMKYLSVLEDDLPSVGVEYPLMIKREHNENALRAVMGVDKETRSLVFAGSVPEGSVVNFSSSPGFEVIEFTRKNIEAFKSENNPDCCLLFSCMARHLALGPLISDEVKIAVKKWKAPLAGFFTYGEIGTNPNAQCDFYNQTFTIALLREISK